MAFITTQDHDGVRVITLDHPPVNSLSYALSGELVPIVEAASADTSITAVVFIGANGQFSAGADINDFGTEPTPQTKTIRDVIAAVEKSEKTFVAAIEKMALGGGFELALACDYRVAYADAKVGLPEIKIGLLPGAGGTQRLPRLIGAQDALDMMLKGRNVKMDEAKEKGIVDQIVEKDLLNAAIDLARKGGKRRVSHRKPWLGKGLVDKAAPFIVSQAHKLVPPEDNGGYAAHKLIDAVEAAMELPFEFGLAREGRLFMELALSKPSAALRHVFFAERELAKIPGLPAAKPLDVKKAGVIGAGTMGTGIAITFAQAGIPVHVIDSNEAAVDKAKQTVMGMFMYQVQKGRMTQEEAWKLGQAVQFTDDYNELADADVVVEAVFENMDVKKEVFAKLDGIVKPEGILASNTSTLDIDQMASVTKRPDKVIGLHFFVPANIMPLLEIVRGKDTSPETIATAFKLCQGAAQDRGARNQCVRVHRQSDDLRLQRGGRRTCRRGRFARAHRRGRQEVRLPDGAVRDERSFGRRCRLAHSQGTSRHGQEPQQRAQPARRDESSRTKDRRGLLQVRQECRQGPRADPGSDGRSALCRRRQEGRH